MGASLSNCHVLVAEDEYFLAADLVHALEREGAAIVGPVPSVADALALIASAQQIDAAILDINLAGEMIFPAADALIERDVPFVFATGYDAYAIPPRFADVQRFEKPLKSENVTKMLASLLTPA